jgi:hypothetical protein
MIRETLPALICACVLASSGLQPATASATRSGLGQLTAMARGPRPARFSAHPIEIRSLSDRLRSAPTESAGFEAGVEIELPLPDGRLERFRAVESSIFAPAFQREHPELRTFLVKGKDEPSLAGRLDLTTTGIRAMLFTPQGTVLIDPLERGRTDAVMSYWLRDDPDAGTPFECGVLDSGAVSPPPARAETGSGGDQLRTDRFILMATGEYTQTLGGLPQALAQMTTAMNRINAIYERDAAVHFNVVQMMAFADPATDPYLPGAGGVLAGRNQAVVDSIFGAGTYDLSQAVSVTPDYTGQAFRPIQCDPSSTLHSGVTGPDPTANQFMAHVMPHEIGHMLGATHTQDRSCNRSLTPVEPSSGLTIMSSLGGACPPDIQPYADPFLHVASIEQVDTVLANPPGCLDLSPTGNTPPTANAGPDYSIPRGTPFVLTGSGSDPDPGDTPSYTWEEIDKAPATGNLTLGPLFRWRPPTSAAVRAFPALATVLSGVADPLEKLPSVDRTLRFRLLVRDNHPGAGGHAWDEMQVTVSGAPFAVTFPNGGNTIPSGPPFTVTWSVGGGSVATQVDILLSTDGGSSWTPLATHTPNDGSESVTYPTATSSSSCRIKVQAVGNIFYDVSDNNFTLVGDPTPTLVTLLQCEPVAEGIVVRWQFADAQRYVRTVVERSDLEPGPWIAPAGERREEGSVTSFLDRTAEPGHSYFYRLSVATADGQTSTFGPIAVLSSELLGRLAITRIAPNPARGRLGIEYTNPREGHLRLRILDAQGRAMATLVDRVQGAGRFQAIWAEDGVRRVAPGIYFVRLDSEAGSAVRRAVISR